MQHTVLQAQTGVSRGDTHSLMCAAECVCGAGCVLWTLLTGLQETMGRVHQDSQEAEPSAHTRRPLAAGLKLKPFVLPAAGLAALGTSGHSV